MFLILLPVTVKYCGEKFLFDCFAYKIKYVEHCLCGGGGCGQTCDYINSTKIKLMVKDIYTSSFNGCVLFFNLKFSLLFLS